MAHGVGKRREEGDGAGAGGEEGEGRGVAVGWGEKENRWAGLRGEAEEGARKDQEERKEMREESKSGSVVQHRPVNQKVIGSIPSQGTCQLQARSLV